MGHLSFRQFLPVYATVVSASRFKPGKTTVKNQFLPPLANPASKPKNLISSLRPITLLNSTYKILSATIANWLKRVLNSIIHPDQTAFLENRFIGENTRTVYDVLWAAYQTKTKGMLLSIDFKSAFDVMSWSFIENCLQKYNFSAIFIKICKCLNQNTFSRIIYNGHASKETIQLERGCRQGDPVSCYFFIIGAEILANRIRQNSRIRGTPLRGVCLKVIQYADDTTFFLDGTEESFRQVFGELGWFAKFSGLMPNVSKSKVMWIGSQAMSSSKICTDIDLIWVDSIKLLGIVFEPRCLCTTNSNILLKKDSILRTIRTWQNRCLTLCGKILIVKSVMLPQLTHTLSSLPNPSDEILREISNILFTFIWGSKRNPLKRMRLCQTYADNGLSMIDIHSFIKSLKMKWIKRLFEGKNSTWSQFVPPTFEQ